MAFVTRFRKIFVDIAGFQPGVILPVQMRNDIVRIGSTTALLGGGGVFASAPAVDVSEYTYITGTCFADQGGTLQFQFSPDGVNWDGETPTVYVANDQLNFKVPITETLFRIRYVNGAAGQGTFRLYWNGSYMG